MTDLERDLITAMERQRKCTMTLLHMDPEDPTFDEIEAIDNLLLADSQCQQLLDTIADEEGGEPVRSVWEAVTV